MKMQNKMTLDELKQKLFQHIISCEFATYESCYSPGYAVVSISNLMLFEPGIEFNYIFHSYLYTFIDKIESI